jgi:hypothetical protein
MMNFRTKTRLPPLEFRGPKNAAAGRWLGEIRGDRKPLSRVSLLQRRRNQRAALRPMRKLLRKQGFAQKLLTPHKLGSYTGEQLR